MSRPLQPEKRKARTTGSRKHIIVLIGPDKTIFFFISPAMYPTSGPASTFEG
jgi:hypothetical protein